MSEIPELERLRQEDFEFEISWAIQRDSISKVETKIRAGKMPPWQRAFIALAQDLDSIPRTHMVAYNRP